MTPIPPYTPGGSGGGGGSTPEAPVAAIAYDDSTNEVVITSSANLSSVTSVEIFGTVFGDIYPPEYTDFSGDGVIVHVSDNELRVPRAYQWFFGYTPGSSFVFFRAELWSTDDSVTPVAIAKPGAPVMIESLASADEIEITYQSIGATVTAVGEAPVDFTSVDSIEFYLSDGEGGHVATTDHFMVLDPQTLQILDVSTIAGETYAAAEFRNADSEVLYTWFGELEVP